MPRNLLPNPYFTSGGIGWEFYGAYGYPDEPEYTGVDGFDGEGWIMTLFPTVTMGSMDSAFMASVEGGTYQFGLRAWPFGDGEVKLLLQFHESGVDAYETEEFESEWTNESGDLLVEGTCPEGYGYMSVHVIVRGTTDYSNGVYLAESFLYVEEPAEPVEPVEPEPVAPKVEAPTQAYMLGKQPWDRKPWVIRYEDTKLAFGTRDTGLIFDEAPDLGTRSGDNEDTSLAYADGRMFGQDFLDGRTLTFSVVVSGLNEHDARARLSQMSTVWRADSIRQNPGAVATLESETGRLTFGRPRRFTHNDYWLPQGVAIVTADFETADDNWYGDENSESITYMPNLGGGLVAPLESPLSTTLSSDRSRAFRISGELATWPIFEITGPITNPVIEIVDHYKLEFRTTLSTRQTMRIDTRPFARSITRDGSSVAGTLSRTSTRLSQAALLPGNYELVLRGTSAARTATATIRWRAAYPTP